VHLTICSSGSSSSLISHLLHLGRLKRSSSLYNRRETAWLTKSTGQDPSCKVSIFSASHKFLGILWNNNVYCCIKNSLLHLPMSWALSLYFFKIRFNIPVPSSTSSPKWTLSFRFIHQTPVQYTSNTRSPFHSSSFHSTNNNWRAHKSLGFLQTHYSVYFFHLRPKISLSAPYFRIPTACVYPFM
jgi:hypothetical protein